MFKALFDRFRTKPPSSREAAISMQTASVEKIWSSWRYEKPARPPPSDPSSKPASDVPSKPSSDIPSIPARDVPSRPTSDTPSGPASAIPTQSVSAAERVNQLKRLGEYEKALQVAL